MTVGVRKPMPGVVYMPTEEIGYYARLGVLTDQTLIGAFIERFRRNPDRVGLSEPGLTVTYGALDEVSDRGAAALWRIGLRPNDRVLFQMRNCKELIYAFFACLKVGVIPVCTLAAHRSHEIGYLGKHARAKAHFVHADDTARFDMVAFARRMRAEIPSVEHVISVRGNEEETDVVSFEAAAAREDPDAARALVASLALDPYQVALFQLSGGTSGVPKIIPRFGNEYRYALQSVIEWLGYDRDTVSFTPNPLMHNAPMACYWGPTLLVGGEVAIAAGPSLADIEATLAERRPNWIALAKVHMLRLAEAGAPGRLHLDHVRGCFVTDSAPQLSRLVGGAPCWPLYGMTEGLLAFVRPGDPVEAVGGTVGRPTSRYDVIRIVQPGTEINAAEGTTGELLVKGPCTIRGYYDAPERNLEGFTSDGFYRSGDLMRFVSIGGERYLVFEGRVKDVVDRGGEKINCSEVENALVLHPEIGAVACVAMPDPLYGERLCAFIVPRKGTQTTLAIEEIARFLAAQGFAKFKCPERIELVEDLPMTSSGKVSKPLMRQMIASRLKAEAALAVKSSTGCTRMAH